jgi:maltose-binding protein MalE
MTQYRTAKCSSGTAASGSGPIGQPTMWPTWEARTTCSPLWAMPCSLRASGASPAVVSCALLAKPTTPEINTLHAVDSTHLGILKSQADYPGYANDRLLSDTLYMLDYNVYQPNHTMYGPWFDIVWEGVVKAEGGEASPEQAAEDTITLLQSELGDVLIVED